MLSDRDSIIVDNDLNKFGVEKSLRNYNRTKKRGCKYFLGKLDYEILRPLLIYKYEREEMHRQDEYIDIIMRD